MQQSIVLDRAGLLAQTTAGRPPKPVTLPDGSTVYVRHLSVADAKPLDGIQDLDTGERLAALVQVCACDPEGVPLFSVADRAALKSLPFAVIAAIAGAGSDLNGLTAKDVEKQEGN